MTYTPEKCPCIYIIAEEGNADVCKLGMTETLDRRVSNLQTSNWRKLTVFAAFQVETSQLAKKVEGELLKRFSNLILRGE
jgi:hypothetical protein